MSAIKLEELWLFKVGVKAPQDKDYGSIMATSREDAAERFFAAVEVDQSAVLSLGVLSGPYYKVAPPAPVPESPWVSGPPPKDGRLYVAIIKKGGLLAEQVALSRWSGRSFEVNTEGLACRPEDFDRHMKDPIPVALKASS